MKKLLTVTILIGIVATAATAKPSSRAKKLIEYGWDGQNPAYIRQNIRQMEKLPFDGLIFGVPGMDNVFTGKKWDESQFAQDFENCRNIRWGKFTDNFIRMLAASTMDWFSDSDWEAVRNNVGLVAKAAALARCRGLCWDPEPYGDNPWNYLSQAHAKEKSFDEYQAKVRQRGAEFMRAITQQLPSAVVHTFFQLSLFGHLMDEPDPAKRNRMLSQEGYGLLPAFLSGMLDAAGPRVLITDGNESSYYYTSPKQYDDVYRMVKQRALSMVAPENVGKYKKQMQMSQALYVDYVFGLGVWGQRSSPAPSLTPEERARWFEHNTYHALRSSDEFVWLYSEKMNWWTNTDLPPGLEEAVRSAKKKLANHEPLGFEVASLIKAAQDRRQKELKSKLITRSAEIPHLETDDQPPVIDGNLEDPVWQKAKVLEPFVPYVGVGTQATAITRARVIYDNKKLYIAVECSEPKKDEMKIVGANHDDSVWEGDSVDIFLSQRGSPTPYVHLILNPKNVQWDALYTNKNIMKFNPKWESAVSLGQNDWTIEVAIPWKELNMKPPSVGEKHRANICRNRIPDSEQTSWSQTFGGFLESENFGTWVFK